MSNNNIDIVELLKLYWDEWKYRHDNFWKRVIQCFVAIVFISTLPVTYQTIGNIKLSDESLYIFPIISILLTVVFLWYSFSEAYRLVRTDLIIKKIISDNFKDEYTKKELTCVSQPDKPVLPIFKKRIAFAIPILLALIELLLSIVIIIAIGKGFLIVEQIESAVLTK